jgi:hypothetical protein
MMAFDQFGDIFDAGADPPQQIPAHHPQPVVGVMIREGGSHFRPVMRYKTGAYSKLMQFEQVSSLYL